MKYSITSIKALKLLIERINCCLLTIRNTNISDLVLLESYFDQPYGKKIGGSVRLTFTAEKTLFNGDKVKLSETIEIGQEGFFIYSCWSEENLNQHEKHSDYRIGEYESERSIPFQLNYSINTIYNILSCNGGTFEMKTNHFSIFIPDSIYKTGFANHRLSF